MRKIVSVSVGLAFTMLMAWGRPAAAQDEPAPDAPLEYRQLVKDALAEFNAGSYAEALALFEQAHRLRRSARVLRGMAKAQFELGMYLSALESIDRALASSIDPLTDSLRQDVLDLRARAARYVGELEIRVEPRSANLLVDGRAVKLGAVPLRIDMGRHVIELEAPGHRPARRTIDVKGGGRTTLAVALEPIPEAARPLVVRQTLVEPSRTPLWVTAGVGVVAVGGVLASSIWLADRADAVERCTRTARGGARCENADQIETQHDLAVGALIGSTALSLGAGVVFVLLLGREGAPAATEAACFPAAGGAGCHASFTW